MATCTTVMARDPFPRTPTPRPTSSLHLLAKRTSYRSLHSPARNSLIEGRPFSSMDTGSPDAPAWVHININSPSTTSHHSFHSDIEDYSFGSPRFSPQTDGLDCHLWTDSDELQGPTSPSTSAPQHQDEFLYDTDSEETTEEKSFFYPPFQVALAATKRELKDISLALWGCPASHQLGSGLHALKQRAEQLSEFETSRTRMIALVGHSRSGKSGVINALLDQPYMQRADFNNGYLFVPTEYRYRPAHHNEPFAFEVDYLSTREIKEAIEELLADFQVCNTPALQGVNDYERRQSLILRSENAWRTLHALFRHQSLFTRNFLLENSAEGRPPVVKILEQWTSELLAQRPGGFSCNTWSSTALNVEELTDKLAAFKGDSIDGNTSALWPIVRVIRVYLRATVLQSGLVLVDCPTSESMTHAHTRDTEHLLRNCHEVFAVTAINHALVDKNVEDLVSCIDRHHPFHIICTKSDDINPNIVEREDAEVLLQVRAWQQQIDSFRRRAKLAEAQRRRGVPGAMEEEVHARDMFEDMEFGLKKFLVERRNRKVATQVLEKHAAHLSGSDAKVFCVSSRDYFEHRYDEQSRAQSRLELSGIVNLRKYLRSVPAEAQFKIASSFIEHDAPAFLGSLKQWTLSGMDTMSEEGATKIREVFKGLEERAIKELVLPSSLLNYTKTNLSHEFASSIVLPIREHRSEWRNAAIEASKEWTKWPAEDYTSFCLRHGHYNTTSTGPRNWNEDIIAPMREHLDPNFTFFHESIEDSRKELVNSIRSLFAEFRQSLDKHIDLAPIALQNFVTNLDKRFGTIATIIATSFSDLLEGSHSIGLDLLHGHSSSYISKLMAPAYRSAVSLPYSPPLSPSLVETSQKDIITSHIASSRIFPKLSTMVEREHRALVHTAFNNMIEGIARQVDALIRDMHLIAVREGRKGDRTGTETRNHVVEAEAQKYPDFRERLQARLVLAEKVLRESRDVVSDLWGLDVA